jgi:hypothetical protein
MYLMGRLIRQLALKVASQLLQYHQLRQLDLDRLHRHHRHLLAPQLIH